MRLETKKNIIWLASYPKSGNTWFRSFITALKNNGTVNINELKTDLIFSDKVSLEINLDLDADELKFSQIDQFRRASLNYRSGISDEKLFIKIHDKYSISDYDDQPIVPNESSFCAIYFVRNPLDVAISMANHNGKPIYHTIDRSINNPKAIIANNNHSLLSQFPQWIGTWNDHIESWKKNDSFPVYFVRYEDMKYQTQETFTEILEKIGFDVTKEEILTAIEATQFEKLRNQETEFGFKEKPSTSKKFFNKGEVGQWKEQLSIEQINKIKQFNEPMMREFGYWE